MSAKYFWIMMYRLPLFMVDPMPSMGVYDFARAMVGMQIRFVWWMPTNWLFVPLFYLFMACSIVCRAKFLEKGDE